MRRPSPFRADGRRPARRGVWVVSLAVVAGPGLLGACGDRRSDGGGVVAGAPDGAALYAGSCSSCHGADLRGSERGPSLLSVVYEPSHHPDESFVRAVREGVTPHHWDFGPMPMIAGLGDDEIEAIIDFVRATQVREGFEPYPPQG